MRRFFTRTGLTTVPFLVSDLATPEGDKLEASIPVPGGKCGTTITGACFRRGKCCGRFHECQANSLPNMVSLKLSHLIFHCDISCEHSISIRPFKRIYIFLCTRAYPHSLPGVSAHSVALILSREPILLGSCSNANQITSFKASQSSNIAAFRIHVSLLYSSST